MFLKMLREHTGIFAVGAAKAEADQQLDLLAFEVEVLRLGRSGEHRRYAKRRANQRDLTFTNHVVPLCIKER